MRGLGFLFLIEQAYTNLIASKLRSLLAILGVFIGTASVVALIGTGQLATEKALSELKALGTDTLAIAVFQSKPGPVSKAAPALPLSFWQSLPSHLTEISSVSPYSINYAALSYKGKTVEAPIIGAEETLSKGIQIALKQGRFVSSLHKMQHVCVIGNQFAEQLKKLYFTDPLGSQLRIGNLLFTIIGIARPWKENNFFNEDINRTVIIPIEAMVLINKNAQINNAVIQLKPKSDVENFILQLKNFIKLQSGDLTLFARTPRQLMDSINNQSQIFSLLLAIIGGVSLLVGGVGVMNVMLVSVTERTKEIGIRKAVGAKNRQIQALFLMESVLLSLMGGLAGVLAGLLFTFLIASFYNWPFFIPWLAPFMGFVVSVATGVFFGFYPARRASQMSSVVCLRA